MPKEDGLWIQRDRNVYSENIRKQQVLGIRLDTDDLFMRLRFFFYFFFIKERFLVDLVHCS